MSRFIKLQCYNYYIYEDNKKLGDIIINVDDINCMYDVYKMNSSGEKELEYVVCLLKSYSGKSCSRELYLKSTVEEISKLINKIG